VSGRHGECGHGRLQSLVGGQHAGLESDSERDVSGGAWDSAVPTAGHRGWPTDHGLIHGWEETLWNRQGESSAASSRHAGFRGACSVVGGSHRFMAASFMRTVISARAVSSRGSPGPGQSSCGGG
jgi:hypothetical protein